MTIQVGTSVRHKLVVNYPGMIWSGTWAAFWECWEVMHEPA